MTRRLKVGILVFTFVLLLSLSLVPGSGAGASPAEPSGSSIPVKVIVVTDAEEMERLAQGATKSPLDEGWVPPTIEELIAAPLSPEPLPAATLASLAWYDPGEKSWNPVSGNVVSGGVASASAYREDAYKFRLSKSGYLMVRLINSPSKYGFSIAEEGPGVVNPKSASMSKPHTDGSRFSLRYLKKDTDYYLYVRVFPSDSGEDYLLSFESPIMSQRIIDVYVDGKLLPPGSYAEVSPETVVVDRIGTANHTLVMYAAEDNYDLLINFRGDKDSPAYFLCADDVDLSHAVGTGLSWSTTELHTLTLDAEQGDGRKVVDGSTPTYATLTLDWAEREVFVYANRRTVKTNIGLTNMSHYYLHGSSSDDPYMWGFDTDVDIDPREDPIIRLGGPLHVDPASLTRFGKPGGYFEQGVRFVTGAGDLLSSVLAGDGSHIWPHYIFTPFDGSARWSTDFGGSLVTVPVSAAEGEQVMSVRWNTGAYAGLLTAEGTFAIGTVGPVMSSIELSPSVVSPGGTVTVTADVRGDRSGVGVVLVYLGRTDIDYMSIDDFIKVDMTYDPALGAYVGQVQVPPDGETGVRWLPYHVRVEDTVHNHRFYSVITMLETFNTYYDVVEPGETSGLVNPTVISGLQPYINAAQNVAQTKTVTPAVVLTLRIGDDTLAIDDEDRATTVELDAVPVIVGTRTFLPARAVIEALGGTVSWDDTEQRVDIMKRDQTISLWIGRSEAVVAGVAVPIDADNPDVKPYLSESGRTMLPLRFIAEKLGAGVEWDEATQEIIITLR